MLLCDQWFPWINTTYYLLKVSLKLRKDICLSPQFFTAWVPMWQRTINFYMDHDEDSNAFFDAQRSSRIWNWITSLMFNPTPTALVRVCLETKFSPSIAVLLVRSHLLFFFFGTWASDILTSSVIYYRKDLLKAQKNLIHLSNSMNRKKIGKLAS